MEYPTLLLYGRDPLFPREGEKALGVHWANQRFIRLIGWGGLKLVLAATFLLVGGAILFAIEWPRTAVWAVPALLVVACGLQMGAWAMEDLQGACAGYATLALLGSRHVHVLFQQWAQAIAAAQRQGGDAFDVLEQDGLSQHWDAQTHLRLFETEAVVVAHLRRKRYDEDIFFPKFIVPERANLIVTPPESHMPFLWLNLHTPNPNPVDEPRPLWFACMRWLASKAEFQTLHVGLPLKGSPVGSAHAQMAFLQGLHAVVDAKA